MPMTPDPVLAAARAFLLSIASKGPINADYSAGDLAAFARAQRAAFAEELARDSVLGRPMGESVADFLRRRAEEERKG